MTGLRDDRDAAIAKLCRLFGDDFKAAKAALLDDLDAIDAAHGPADSVIAVKPSDDMPGDAAIAAWIEAHPDEFSAWYRKQARIHGSTDWAMPAASASRPAPRRRART